MKELKEIEQRDLWYWSILHNNFVAAVERGKQDKRNCQRCGGQGFISVLRSYTVETAGKNDERVRVKRWVQQLRPCSCQSCKKYKTEPADIKEIKAVFG